MAKLCSICGQEPLPLPTISTSHQITKNIEDFEDYDEEQRLYPSELDLIHMVCLEYTLSTKYTCIQCLKSQKNPEKLTNYLDRRNWKLVDTFYKDYTEDREWFSRILSIKFDQGQHAATCYNTVTQQLVIVHRGTEPSNWESVKADKKEVVEQVVGKFAREGYGFSKATVESFTSQHGITPTSITITGHSLGGFVSQMVTLFIKYPEYLNPEFKHNGNAIADVSEAEHVHCISFDGPGCKEIIENMMAKYLDDRQLRFRILDSLDITVYLSSVNWVNIINEQVGSVFQLQCKSIFPELESESWGDWWQRFYKSHSSDKILKFWEKYNRPRTIYNEAEILKVVDREIANSLARYKKLAPKTIPAQVEFRNLPNAISFRMSCFDRNERDAIKDLYEYAQHHKNDPSWAQYCDKYSCIKFLTTGFDLRKNFQILILELKPDSREGKFPDLYRDYVIRKTKLAVSQFKELGISSKFSDFLEGIYISRTREYVHTLPDFTGKAAGALETLKCRFEDSGPSGFIISVGIPNGDTRICSAKVFKLLQDKYLKDPKEYFVLNTRHLRAMNPYLENASSDFLCNLKYVVIECFAESHLQILKSWVERLATRDRKFVIIHNDYFDIKSLFPGLDVIDELQLKQQDVSELCNDINVGCLIVDQTVQFKLEENRINLAQLLSDNDETGNFFNSIEGLGCSRIYSAFKGKENNFSALLPELGKFEESYFIERSFQEIAVTGYSKEELMIVVSDSKRHDTFLKDFIKKEHADPDLVIYRDGQGEFKENTHKFILISNLNGLWAYDEIVKAFTGHVLEVTRTETSEYKMLWHKSFGKPHMSKLKVAGFGLTHYNLLLGRMQHGQVTLIADEPGTGKTTIMQKLALFSQKSDKCSWTNFTKLGDRKTTKILHELTRSRSALTREAVVETLAKLESGEELVAFDLIKQLLSHLIMQEGKVRIFFDGLDEINDATLKLVVLVMADVLVRETRARVFIASRKRLMPELKERFHIPYFKLNPLTENEQVKFIRRYWTNHKAFKAEHAPSMRDDILDKYIIMFLGKFRKAIGSDADKLCGIPFQLRMLAGGYLRPVFFRLNKMFAGWDTMPNIGELENFLPEFSNTIDLYQLFIEGTIQDGLETKLGRDVTISDSEIQKLEDALRLISFDKIFCPKQRGQITVSSPLFPDLEDHVLYSCGLITNYCPNSANLEESDNSEVIHQTLPEFSAAEFIFLILKAIVEGDAEQGQAEAMKEFLNLHIFLPQYENVRMFLNMLIVYKGDTPVALQSIATSRVSVEGLSQYFGSGSGDRDMLGRNALHYFLIYTNLGLDWLATNCVSCDLLHACDTTNLFMKAEYLWNDKDYFDAKPFAYILSNSNASKYLKYTEYYDGHIDTYRDICLFCCSGKFQSQTYPPGHSIGDVLDENKLRILELMKRKFWDSNERIAKHLADWSIELRRNAVESNFFNFCDMEGFDLEFVIKFGEGSRINFLCRAARNKGEKIDFEESLLLYFHRDSYKQYGDLIKYLDTQNETYLLRLFKKYNEHNILDFHIDNLQTAVYKAWEATNFMSLTRALDSHLYDYHRAQFFEVFYELTPKLKNLDTNCTILRNIKPNLLKIAAQPSTPGRNKDIFCIFPIVLRLLNKETREVFVSQYKQLILDSLSTEPILGTMHYEKMLEWFLESLSATAYGWELLRQ